MEKSEVIKKVVYWVNNTMKKTIESPQDTEEFFKLHEDDFLNLITSLFGE